MIHAVDCPDLAGTYMCTCNGLIDEIVEETNRAQKEYHDFASMHEAYGVLAEEVAELFDCVRLKQNAVLRDRRIREEAIQVAAVALRIAEQADRVTR